MTSFILVEPHDKSFRSLNKTYKAKSAFKAAKKAFRDFKACEKIYIYDPSKKTVHGFSTKTFFTKKKPHLINRRR